MGGPSGGWMSTDGGYSLGARCVGLWKNKEWAKSLEART